jgi:hypothetical protein
MDDVAIDQVSTSIEVADPAPPQVLDERTLTRIAAYLRTEKAADAMRDEDSQLRDRAWRSDVKPV